MANQTYVPSRCIHVFPCATRTYDTNNASKFLTQYNLTNFLGGGKSYNLTKQNDHYMRFSIKGYFVQIDYTSTEGAGWWEAFLGNANPQAEQVLCAQINLAAAVSQSGDFVDTGNVNNQSKLTGFADPVSKKTPPIDAGIGSNGESVFTALKLAFLSVDDFDKLSDSVKLATVVEDTENPGQNKLQWQLYSESLKFAQVGGSDNDPNITIQLSQDPVTKEISATAKYAQIGTDQLADGAVSFDKMKVDTQSYRVDEVTDSSIAGNEGPLRVKLVENTSSNTLKTQLLGLVQTADIANNAVTYSKMKVDTNKHRMQPSGGSKEGLSVILGEFETNSGKLGAKLQGLAQTADIANNAVTTEKLGGGAVTTAKIVDLAVTTAKLADDVQDKLEHIGQLKMSNKWYNVTLSGSTLTLTAAT